MTEQRSGLRFDIYERVHLAEGTAAIQELDELELIPHIQVASLDEQAVLKGSLWLGGRYVGEGNEAGRTLEHLIPVEITLPLSRIHRLDEVTVEIENFDVELLSSRILNVTGVLTLNGVDMLTANPEEWSEPEESSTFMELKPTVARAAEAAHSNEDKITVKAAFPPICWCRKFKGKEVVRVQRWWWKVRLTCKGVLFPLICIQFVRTLLLPNPLDVFILFLFFMFYLGFLFNMY